MASSTQNEVLEYPKNPIKTFFTDFLYGVMGEIRFLFNAVSSCTLYDKRIEVN